MDTDELDGQGRRVKVTATSFANQCGIAEMGLSVARGSTTTTKQKVDVAKEHWSGGSGASLSGSSPAGTLPSWGRRKGGAEIPGLKGPNPGGGSGV